ncbi:sperm microtubule associated protein 1-like [Clytia hemisphaerica]|uniref:sperm microtubule associated protein 1-like n=1 Tax=Clytia hemisphaerica TaxID=252671 RepID=UPI0034D771A1
MTRGGPPELSPADKIKREKGFVLDCVAVGTLSVDSESYNPKHATGIPPYNAKKDATVKSYFKSPVVKSALKRTGQDGGGESMMGKQTDRFHTNGSMGKYLKERNRSGAGYSTLEVAGHELFMSNPKPIIGYNGSTGLRRNTPSLRTRPSVFESK